MAERERRQTPPFGGVFVSHARIMTTDDMGRAVRRMAHEVIERNHGLDDLVVVGLQTGGVPIAERLAETLADIEGLHPLVDPQEVPAEAGVVSGVGAHFCITPRSTPARCTSTTSSRRVGRFLPT